MKFLIGSILLITYVPNLLFAFGNITGTLINENNDPIAYATLALYNSDSVLIDGTITSETGEFSFKNIKEGNYYIEVNYLGYSSKIIQNLSINSSKKNLLLGSVTLQMESTILNDVSITANKTYLQNTVDRKIIRLNQDLNAASGDLGNTLSTMSSFSINTDGSINFRGSQNYQVLIDGKPSGFAGSETLRNIPAAAVKEIEIITNPSAKYISKRDVCVINIIMKKDLSNGFSGQFGISMDYRDKGNYVLNSNVHMNYKNEKLRIYLLVSDSKDTIQLDGTTDLKIENEDYIFNRERAARQLLWANDFNSQLGLDYRFNSKHTLSLWSSINNRKTDYKALNNDAESESNISPRWGSLVYQNNFNRDQWQVSLEDKLETGNMSLQFLIDYSHANNVRNNFRNYYQSDSLFSNFIEMLDSTQFYQTELRDRFHSEINFEKPMRDSSILELGFLNELYLRNNNFKQFTFGLPIENTNLDFQFGIFNAYGVYSYNGEKISLQIGGRVEYSIRRLGGFQNSSLFTLFPSFHMSKPLPKGYDVKFSYSKRIRRPTVFDLSPIFMYSDNQVTWKGNPELTDAMIHSIELGVSKTYKSSTFNLDIYYRYIKNGWYRLLEQVDTYQFINYPIAINSEQNLGVEFMNNWEISDKVRLILSGSVFKQVMKNKNMTDVGENLSSKFNFSFKYLVSNTFSVQIDANYNGPQLFANSIITQAYFVNILAQKQLFKKHLSITFALKDIAGTDIYEQTYTGSNVNNSAFWLQEYYPSSSRFISLSLQYNFSKYERKQVNRNIQIID